MKCSNPSAPPITAGVCGGCLHYLDNHADDGSCLSCTEVYVAVLRKWASGEGKPPEGIPSWAYSHMIAAEQAVLDRR